MRREPWWLVGLYLVVASVFGAMVYSSFTNNVFVWLLVGVGISLPLIHFILVVVEQRPQFSIKSLLIMTSGVAVLCSIYTYGGFFLVFACLLTLLCFCLFFS